MLVERVFIVDIAKFLSLRVRRNGLRPSLDAWEHTLSDAAHLWDPQRTLQQDQSLHISIVLTTFSMCDNMYLDSSQYSNEGIKDLRGDVSQLSQCVPRKRNTDRIICPEPNPDRVAIARTAGDDVTTRGIHVVRCAARCALDDIKRISAAGNINH